MTKNKTENKDEEEDTESIQGYTETDLIQGYTEQDLAVILNVLGNARIRGEQAEQIARLIQKTQRLIQRTKRVKE